MMDLEDYLTLERPATKAEIRRLVDKLMRMGESRKNALRIVDFAEIYVRPRSPIARVGFWDGVTTMLWAAAPAGLFHSKPPEVRPTTQVVISIALPLDRSYSMEGELERDEHGQEVLVLRRYDTPAEGTAASEVPTVGDRQAMARREAWFPTLDGTPRRYLL